ncbi:hypothetical protein SNOG_15630 [Parastagonospora nodorum SN15]|uniref:Uncharacterized protein n=1 Tax=Phaeosphaeria nodorum (strain SN15 / ATCC MYA-4574 / FGSC 10173) TaxID=321614 RepID=Q0TY00_PHANO|nr:hypothetical protein SNOG_15630 [Parastagonospora nodorum SN15]EAT77005.1 hypothetical protein SNOG_15630 [Parastagonospora nodorum SN15]
MAAWVVLLPPGLVKHVDAMLREKKERRDVVAAHRQYDML